MFEFGFYALILLLMALGFITVPLLLGGPVARESDDSANIALAQSKLRELRAELKAGNLTQAQFAAAKHEVEVGLYRDMQGDKQQNPLTGNGRWLAVPLLFVVPIVALGLYAQLGDFRAFMPQPQAASQNAGVTEDQINQMVAKLAARMRENPDDLQGWIMLGRSYKTLKRFGEAVEAYRKALALDKTNADVLLQLADTLAMASGGGLQGEPSELIEQAIKLDPDNEMGMWLAGLSKAESGDYDAAIALWKKLQQHYQPGSRDHQEVQQLIDTALERSGKSAETAKPAPAPASASSNVNVRVALGERFKNQVNPDDSVLIYVKAASGPKMPLAVVKKQVRDLPLEISFDDSMAMVPGMTVSSFDKVVVTARVSRSGNAMPSSGEPVGSVEAAGEQRKSVNVVIDAQVP